MTDNDYLAMAYANGNDIIGLYNNFKEKRPVMLFDIEDWKIYAYPYVDFKSEMNGKSQAIMTKQYEEACTKNQVVVFVKDAANKKLVSFCMEHLGTSPASIPQRPQHIHNSYRRQQKQHRIRRPGGGRKLVEEKDPAIVTALERMLTDEVAGDPMSEQKWIRSSTRRLSDGLAAEGHQASSRTVSRLLKQMGFSLKANQRKHGKHGCPERDEQFKYIASQKQRFIKAGLPVISIDTKKKELIGAFISKGRTWRREAEEVNEHDFPGAAVCRAVPFGIYDVGRNEGHVYVGVSNNTPEFAVHSIARWWKDEGSQVYPKTKKLLILADGGGSNGCRVQAWKHNLQEKLCDEFGLTVTVSHYPTGCSKWNPVEHRLFSFISRNWEGKPLKTLETMLAYIRGTSTKTGLRVKAFLDKSVYKKGQKLTGDEVRRLRLEPHAVYPTWNYTLRPRRPRDWDKATS